MKVFMKTQLNKQFCEICLKGRKAFICEQILYSPFDMKRHMSRGDVEGPLAEGGFKGHPICEFCRNRFFSETELFKHNTERHETCFICRRQNPLVYRYFRDYNSLEEHFRNKHYPCMDPLCIERRFVVFSNATELQHHQFEQHERTNPNSTTSRSQRRDALTIETNFQFSRPATRNHRGARRFQLEARQEYEIDSRAQESIESTDNFINQRVTLTDEDFPAFVDQSTRGPTQPKWPVTGHRQSAGLRHESFPSLPGQNWNNLAFDQNKKKGGLPTLAERVAQKTPVKKPTVAQPVPNPNLRPLHGMKNSSSMPQLKSEETPTQDSKTSWVTLSKTKANDDFPTLCDKSVTVNTPVLWRPNVQQIERPKAEPPPSNKPKKASISDTNAFPSLGGPMKTTNKIEKTPERKSKVSEGLRAANKALIRKLKSQMDGLTFEAFHQESEIFMQDRLVTETFHDRLVNYGLAHYISEIASLCPNVSKRSELLQVHGLFINQCKQAPDSAPIFVPIDVLVEAHKRAIERPNWSCPRCSMMNTPDADFCEGCDASMGASIPKQEGTYRRNAQTHTLFNVENGVRRNQGKNPWDRNKRS
eukprot:g7242.t1